MKAWGALLCRDIRLSFGRSSEGITAIAFFLVVSSLFPIALGGDPNHIRPVACGVIWVSALLAALLSLDSIYHRDFEDGSFDMMLLSPVSPLLIVAVKMLTHWLVSGLTLVMAAIVAGGMLFIPMSMLITVIPSLFLGTIYMSLMGGLGAILTLGTRRPGLLMALLALPLLIPMLILGVMAGEAALAGLSSKAYVLLQLALVIIALPAAPLLGSTILQMQVRSS